MSIQSINSESYGAVLIKALKEAIAIKLSKESSEHTEFK